MENKLANARKVTSDTDQDDRPLVFYIGGQTESVATTMGARSIIYDWAESTGGNSAAEVIGAPFLIFILFKQRRQAN